MAQVDFKTFVIFVLPNEICLMYKAIICSLIFKVIILIIEVCYFIFEIFYYFFIQGFQ